MTSGHGSLLALDATGEWCSVAWTDGTRWVEDARHAGQRHSEMLLHMIDAALREAGVRPQALTEIAFGAGPGSFTGLRIACGIAQGLALGAGLPLRPVSSLLALARRSGAEAAIAAIDARMGEVYWAACRHDARDGWQALAGPRVDTPAAVALQIAKMPSGTGWAGVGNAFSVYPELAAALPPGSPIDAAAQVSARGVAELALSGHGAPVPAELAAPLYVRDRVALTTAERAAGRP